MRENRNLYKKWINAEFAAVHTNPVSEMDYGLYSGTVLKKFNPLIPSIR